uniref:YczE/YyaS/YitT family protein n=1 Tax=uncultured Methanobrevibacter sp. TaxID=253161 RepID=UPI0025DF6024
TNLSVGIVIFLFTILFIVIQIALLGKGFEKRQYLQLVIGFIFSFFVDFSVMLVNFINPIGYINQFLLLLFSCLVVAFGVLLEIQTEVVYLPADGVIVAISQVLKKEFPKVKPFVDTSMVIIAAILSIVFLGYLAGVREGTIISALIIGPIVKILKKYFDPYVSRLFEK